MVVVGTGCGVGYVTGAGAVGLSSYSCMFVKIVGVIVGKEPKYRVTTGTVVVVYESYCQMKIIQDMT